MNLVALLIAPAVVTLNFGPDANLGVRVLIALGAAAIIVGAVLFSKRTAPSMGDDGSGKGDAAAAAQREKVAA
jgi:K(+)-stimulated pyrophosphate-energized sodium pump